MAESADALDVVVSPVVVVAPVDVPLVSVGAGAAAAGAAAAAPLKLKVLRVMLASSDRPLPSGVKATDLTEKSRPDTSSAPSRTATRLRNRYSRSVSE